MTEVIILYLLTALVISLITTAIYISTWPGMVFYKLANIIETYIISLCKKKTLIIIGLHHVSMEICKPLFRCLICMSSFWGLIAWAILWIAYEYYFNPVLLVLIICGINTLITSIISNLLPDDE